MERLQRVLHARSMGGDTQAADQEQVDTAEQVYISSLALLKMLKHGTAPSFISHHNTAASLLMGFVSIEIILGYVDDVGYKERQCQQTQNYRVLAIS